MRRSVLRVLLLTIVVLLSLAQGQAAHASTITVSTTDDELNSDGDCSLREAIQAANTDAAVDACTGGSGADTIAVPAGTYTLAIAGAAENANASGDLDIAADLTIASASAATTIIDGAGLDRVFDIVGATVEISGLTIQNGLGGIFNNGTLILNSSTVSGNTLTGCCGGGIFSFGPLTLNNSTVAGNSAVNGGGGIHHFGVGTLVLNGSEVSGNSGGSGGGILSGGTLTLTDSTVSGNMASGDGGGIFNGFDLVIANSTVSGNTASGAIGGGGILVNGLATLTATNTTVSSNTSDFGSGGISSLGTTTLKNTIVANNGGDGNCNPEPGAFISNGHNLSGDGSCPFAGSGDLVNTDPLLGSLQDNGGPTQTHALLTGSPAIDAGSGDCPPPASDQRGGPRPIDGDGDGAQVCDIGAYEFGSLARPPNDDFPGGEIPSLPFTDSVDTTNATEEVPSEPICTTPNNTLWYSFTPTSDTLLRVDTFGSNFLTDVCVYVGASLADLAQVASGGDEVIFPASAGQTYYFQVIVFSGILVFHLNTAGEPDSDGDGIPDAEDTCPNDPEDIDGFQDEDGCPEEVVDLAANKVASPTEVLNLGTVQFNITVTNIGDTEATNSVLTDSLPEGFKLIAFPLPSQGSCSSSEPGELSCNLGTITPGQTVTLQLFAETPCLDKDKGRRFRNTARASADLDSNMLNNVSRARVTVLPDEPGNSPCRQKLAERFAPILWLAEGDYEPEEVEIMLNETGFPGARLNLTTALREQVRLGIDPTVAFFPTADTLADHPEARNYVDIRGINVGDEDGYRDQYEGLAATYDPVTYSEVRVDRRQVIIDYWFFYYYDDYGFLDHEGDWEHVEVRINARSVGPALEPGVEPIDVSYSQHACDGRGRTNTRLWSTIETEGTHPVVFVARGSHANYFIEGEQAINRCTLTDVTFREVRREPAVVLIDCADPAGAQPWLLFRGAWGEEGGVFGSARGPCRD